MKEQRIDIYEAVEIFTINGTRMGFEEDQKGSIEPGKLADFVVLSDDPYSVPKEDIENIHVEITIIGGNIVHRNENSADRPETTRHTVIKYPVTTQKNHV